MNWQSDLASTLQSLTLRVLALLAFALAAEATLAAALAPGDYEFALTHQGLRRSYLVHMPPQAAQGKALPVVLNFHGGGSNAEVQKSYSRMDRSADRDGYIALYPNGSAGIGNRFLTWNAGACCGPAAALQIDDVGFVQAILDELPRRTPIDTGRIYATGLSNGSMMAYRVAAELSARIAAVAGVAGAMAIDRFAPSLSVPVMHVHSTGDHIARYDGGLGPPSTRLDTRNMNVPVEVALKKWIDHDGCPVRPATVEAVAGPPGTPDEAHSAIRRVYRPCRDGVEVVLWQLTGPGHVWPGGVRDYNPALLGTGTAVIDANSEMWRFFSRFKR